MRSARRLQRLILPPRWGLRTLADSRPDAFGPKCQSLRYSPTSPPIHAVRLLPTSSCGLARYCRIREERWRSSIGSAIGKPRVRREWSLCSRRYVPGDSPEVGYGGVGSGGAVGHGCCVSYICLCVGSAVESPDEHHYYYYYFIRVVQCRGNKFSFQS